jgi:hypothetical protein
MALTDTLRVALGRKLTQKQMRMAQVGDPNHVPGEDPNHMGSGTFENIAVVGDKIVQRIRQYEYCVTPDASEGRRVLHRGFYPVRDEQRRYNQDGFLEERHVARMNDGLYITNRKTLVYEPAGRFIGKRKKEDIR